MSFKQRPPRSVGHNIRFRTGAADAIHQLMLSISLQDKDAFTESCVNCVNFDEPKELCRKFQQRPPARIIAYGCTDYEDVETTIPF